MSAPAVRVYISGPSLHMRPGNTDWQYLRMLERLPEFSSNITVYRERSSQHTLLFNLRYGAGIAGRRLGIPALETLHPGAASRLPLRDLRRSAADVVYAYGYCPVNTSSTPRVFHTGAIDRSRLLREGVSAARMDAMVAEIRRLATTSALLTANTQTALDNLAESMPELASKMRTLPFLLPHLQPVDKEAIARKFRNGGPLRLLFVGREARRKGLPEVLAAFERLDAALPSRLQLTVISSLDDGAVDFPRMPNLVHLRGAGREAVQRQMRESHLLLMPSHFEGYGWVYLEAMASGTVPLATDAPIQREILAGGESGILAKPDPGALVAALTPLLHDLGAMEALALRAWRRCERNYLPTTVAARMHEVFAEAQERGRQISK